MAILLESQESSSPMITRAVASALQGKRIELYDFSLIEKLALRLVGQLPQAVAAYLIPRVNPSKALKLEQVLNLKTDDLVNGRLKDYSCLEGRFPAVTIGVGMGGTTAHISTMLNSPFLPQAFVLTLENGTMHGDVNQYFALTDYLAKSITDNNPDLMSIQHYDPVHDGWLVKRVNHLRLKLIDLPEEYKKFIKKKVVPGGDVLFLDGQAKWKRFRTGINNVFQVGGWGDISAEEFLYGSERLEKFSKAEKLGCSHWFLENYPLEFGPESEWGCESGLSEATEEFCRSEGFNFVKISYEDPNDFSQLAFQLKKRVLEEMNITPAGVVVETFSQYDTALVDKTALLPLWLIFNTFDSLRFLKKMVPIFPAGKPVFFSGLATFSYTPDLVPWREWENALIGFQTINIGARKSHYPADAKALLDWKKPLERWSIKNPGEIQCQASVVMAKDLSKEIGNN
jgi:hypothetical protein